MKEMLSYYTLTNWGLVTRVYDLCTPLFIREVKRLAQAVSEACDKRLRELGETP